MSFADIKGNLKNITALKKLIEEKRLPSSMLFHGPESGGKFLIALQTVKMSLCTKTKNEDSLFDQEPKEADKSDSCDKCDACIQIDKRLHPDVRVLDYKYQADLEDEPEEKQTAIKIDSIRNILKFAYEKPYISEKKFILINEADTMTTEAQNSTLKLLEEPPESTIIILVAADTNKLLPTIMSRTFRLKFNSLPQKDLAEILGAKMTEHKQALFLSSLAKGSVKKAFQFKELINELKEKKHMPKLLPFAFSSSLRGQGYENRAKVKILLDFLISSVENEEPGDFSQFMDREKELRHLMKMATYLKHNVSPKIIAELALINYSKTRNFNFGE